MVGSSSWISTVWSAPASSRFGAIDVTLPASLVGRWLATLNSSTMPNFSMNLPSWPVGCKSGLNAARRLAAEATKSIRCLCAHRSREWMVAGSGWWLTVPSSRSQRSRMSALSTGFQRRHSLFPGWVSAGRRAFTALDAYDAPFGDPFGGFGAYVYSAMYGCGWGRGVRRGRGVLAGPSGPSVPAGPSGVHDSEGLTVQSGWISTAGCWVPLMRGRM